jgi:hypothetical protein
MLDAMIEKGISCMPKDKRALAILKYLSGGEASGAVNRFLNTRFASLPAGLKPVFKVGNNREVAFWECDGIIADRIKDLVSVNGKVGSWSDVDGEKVVLISLNTDD